MPPLHTGDHPTSKLRASMEGRLASLLASKPRIILGSASSSRRGIMDELAARHGFKYDVRTADIDERAIFGHHREEFAPRELVCELAHAKVGARAWVGCMAPALASLLPRAPAAAAQPPPCR